MGRGIEFLIQFIESGSFYSTSTAPPQHVHSISKMQVLLTAKEIILLQFLKGKSKGLSAVALVRERK
jgi:hypothetical protein